MEVYFERVDVVIIASSSYMRLKEKGRTTAITNKLPWAKFESSRAGYEFAIQVRPVRRRDLLPQEF